MLDYYDAKELVWAALKQFSNQDPAEYVRDDDLDDWLRDQKSVLVVSGQPGLPVTELNYGEPTRRSIIC